MVKRPRIAAKPASTPAADDWVKDGGLDPEIVPPAPQLQAEPAPPPAPPEEKGKAYPHRISFDTDKAQYKRLKRASFEEERSLNEILRDAAEAWLKEHEY